MGFSWPLMLITTIIVGGIVLPGALLATLFWRLETPATIEDDDDA
jgi:hypothetical protein